MPKSQRRWQARPERDLRPVRQAEHGQEEPQHHRQRVDQEEVVGRPVPWPGTLRESVPGQGVRWVHLSAGKTMLVQPARRLKEHECE